jgi:hypothetical protein
MKQLTSLIAVGIAVLLCGQSANSQRREATLHDIFFGISDWSKVSVIAGDGEYLGNLDPSTVSRNSIFNTVGPHGSSVSRKSMFNTVGTYGSTVGRFSPLNTVCGRPPTLIVNGKAVCYVTNNTTKNPRIPIELLKVLPNLRKLLGQRADN